MIRVEMDQQHDAPAQHLILRITGVETFLSSFNAGR
jgi:hypothetical protein